MSAATVAQGLSGTCCGIKCSLWLLRWCFWQVLHWDIISSIAPLILGQNTACTSRSCSAFIYSKMTFMNAVKNFWSQAMRNYYSITLEHQSLIAAYFISVVPVWPGFCGCFIPDLRLPIHDNRLQLLKFWVLFYLSVPRAWVLKSFQSPRPEFQTHQADLVFRQVSRLWIEYLLIEDCCLVHISHWLRKAWFEGSSFGDGEELDEWVSSRLLPMVCGHFILLQHSVCTRNHGSVRSQKLSPASLFRSVHSFSGSSLGL